MKNEMQMYVNLVIKYGAQWQCGDSFEWCRRVYIPKKKNEIISNAEDVMCGS